VLKNGNWIINLVKDDEKIDVIADLKKMLALKELCCDIQQSTLDQAQLCHQIKKKDLYNNMIKQTDYYVSSLAKMFVGDPI
jgi:hypothetical protein